jgi:hypothetical protein
LDIIVAVVAVSEGWEGWEERRYVGYYTVISTSALDAALMLR